MIKCTFFIEERPEGLFFAMDPSPKSEGSKKEILYATVLDIGLKATLEFIQQCHSNSTLLEEKGVNTYVKDMLKRHGFYEKGESL